MTHCFYTQNHHGDYTAVEKNTDSVTHVGISLFLAGKFEFTAAPAAQTIAMAALALQARLWLQH